MAVVKWDPFRDLVSIQDRMNRLFEQTLSRSRGEEGVAATTWTPPVDIYETAETIVMKAEVPGVAREEAPRRRSAPSPGGGTPAASVHRSDRQNK